MSVPLCLSFCTYVTYFPLLFTPTFDLRYSCVAVVVAVLHSDDFAFSVCFYVLLLLFGFILQFPLDGDYIWNNGH